MSKVITGPKTAIKLTLQPLSSAATTVAAAVTAPCVPAISELFWFSDDTGTFSANAESAFLLPSPNIAAGPVLGVAKLSGERCGSVVLWSKTWTPQDSAATDSDPGYLEDENMLVVFPLSSTAPGSLVVSASCAGNSYGPIALMINSYSCDQWVSKLDNTFWAPASGSAAWVSWTGSSWAISYPGDEGNAVMVPIGGWQSGYRPLKIRFTLQINNPPAYSLASVYLSYVNGQFGSDPLTMTPGNTYQMIIDFTENSDIAAVVAREIGSSSGLNYIVGIDFLE